MKTSMQIPKHRRRTMIWITAGALAAAAAAVISIVASSSSSTMPSHASPVDRMIAVVTGGPSSPILEEIDAAHVTLNDSIWGREDRPELAIRVACDHLTQAHALATEPGAPLTADLRVAIDDVRAYACEYPDPQSIKVHNETERLYEAVAEQLR